MWTSSARQCRSSGCNPPPSCVVSSFAPKGDSKLTWMGDCYQRALCLGVASRLSAARLLIGRVFVCIQSRKHIGVAEREISMSVYGYSDFQIPPYMASRPLLIPRIEAVGTSFSPLPCQARHGYMVTSAHRVEVEVGADGHASAPPSGAAAAAPPAGAV
jgi:hypothetical protein